MRDAFICLKQKPFQYEEQFIQDWCQETLKGGFLPFLETNSHLKVLRFTLQISSLIDSEGKV